jgi:predicted alpha/beta-fold hydrolase
VCVCVCTCTYPPSLPPTHPPTHTQVGVVNMRSCGRAPVTSPRFFSAFRGATDDVRVAVAHIRKQLPPGAKVAVVGWSNGATILNNCLAEQASSHNQGRDIHGADAGVSLACPLNMPLGVNRLPCEHAVRCPSLALLNVPRLPFEHAVEALTRKCQPLATACPFNLPLASGNLKRWFHSNVYDRSIARSLSTKIAEWKDLFLNEEGASKPVPAWEGLGPDKTFVADQSVLTGQLRTIREIDEAITRRCFGFDTVDDYYGHASSDQRLHLIDVPCMMINAVY